MDPEDLREVISAYQKCVAAFLKPALTPTERTVAQVEGWILGVA